MTVDSSRSIPLPHIPSTLCFEKDGFLKEDFNVDQFILECRRKVQLETLRDDLALYLKILRSAMIELINKDYADFVNLSSNLIGLDKAIGNLTVPLGQLKEEVLSVRNAMHDAIVLVEEQLRKKQEIKQQKACLQRLLSITQSVDKIERLLGIQHSSSEQQNPAISGHLNGQLIERVATEFNKLQYCVTKSKGLPLVEKIKLRITNITSTLQYSLEGSFLAGLENGNVEILRQCLRTYALIDKIKDAENLYRQHVVRPYMEKVIGEHFLKSSNQGLQEMYVKIMEFIPQHFEPLRNITSASSGTSEILRGYDFIVNAVWPEIVSNIEARAPSMFAPGNPDLFHQRFTVTAGFLNQFEKQCGSQASLKRLHTHSSYNAFMTKWSLPVYFQIRFQEIAGSVESSLCTLFDRNTDQTPFHLHSTSCLWQCLQRCWADDVYLQPLCHRLWKLTVQLVIRYRSCLQETYEKEVIKRKDSGDKPKFVNESFEQSQSISSQTQDGQTTVVSTPATIGQILCLLSDAEKITEQLQVLFVTNILPRIEAIEFQNVEELSSCLQDCSVEILKQLPKFQIYVVEDVTNQCSVQLKQVSDIPRLYRRTNREVPSKPSAYLSSLVKPLKMFVEEHENLLTEKQKKEVFRHVFTSLAEQYFSVTSDVLKSVKTMEDSLKRLKRGRGTEKSSQGMSDDDKIRLQLILDLASYRDQVASYGVGKECFESIQKLLTLSEDAKAAMTNQQS